jgi:RNA polymerase sigma-70 factor, ECF subfamily
MATRGEVTQLLHGVRMGDESAVDRLAPLVYEELRRVARGIFRRERADHTLQPTALVHEVFMKLVDESDVNWQSRAHFMAIAARAMRRVLVDHSRAQSAEKRGGGNELVPLDQAVVYSEDRSPEILLLDRALDELAALDPRQARIVELRFFGGLTGEEIAEAVGISTATVTRELRVAQAWLYRAMSGKSSGAAASPERR